MLTVDHLYTPVKTLNRSGRIPKGTIGKIIGCSFITGTSARVYLFQTEESIEGLVEGKKTFWFIERDLINI